MNKNMSTNSAGQPCFKMTVESSSSNPYHSGFIEIEATESKLSLRWMGTRSCTVWT
jgi:hypothetical protein